MLQISKALAMKKHLASLSNLENRWWTLSLVILSVSLVAASRIVGITDNLPGILLLFFGMITLFLAFLHPWRNSRNYAALSGVSLGVIVLTFAVIYLLSVLKKTEYISEAVVMIIVFLFGVPGIVVGISGTLFYTLRKK